MTAIQLRGVSKRYGRRAILEEIDLTVGEGEFLVVFGPPACGKSVLLRMITGLEKPTGGAILLRGRDAAGQSPAERNIGYVPQSFALYPHYSVHDNIAYPLALMRMARREIEPKVQEVAQQLKIAHLLGKRPEQLSGGEKQRVALARGIVKPTDLFVLDDPLTGLDFKLREQLFEDLKAMQRALRATFVYMTSDPLEALALADRIAVLDGGRVLETGEIEAVYREPAHVRTMELLGVPPSNRMPAVVRRREGALRCDAGLFEFALDAPPAALADGQRVELAIRPQDIVLGADGRDGLLSCRAQVLLEEDLGAEVVVFLRAGETPLVTVLPWSAKRGGLTDEQVSIGVHPAAVSVFAADTGARLGRGA
ncbi:MAG TPA: ABC transporter ATP-binding protein [Anaeromyxobacteraceae bacterium]|nr:ABC transporter ATP-binding protein [Anaeromyxobacteraceae bacterium]